MKLLSLFVNLLLLKVQNYPDETTLREENPELEESDLEYLINESNEKRNLFEAEVITPYRQEVVAALLREGQKPSSDFNHDEIMELIANSYNYNGTSMLEDYLYYLLDKESSDPTNWENAYTQVRDHVEWNETIAAIFSEVEEFFEEAQEEEAEA